MVVADGACLPWPAVDDIEDDASGRARSRKIAGALLVFSFLKFPATVAAKWGGCGWDQLARRVLWFAEANGRTGSGMNARQKHDGAMNGGLMN